MPEKISELHHQRADQVGGFELFVGGQCPELLAEVGVDESVDQERIFTFGLGEDFVELLALQDTRENTQLDVGVGELEQGRPRHALGGLTSAVGHDENDPFVHGLS